MRGVQTGARQTRGRRQSVAEKKTKHLRLRTQDSSGAAGGMPREVCTHWSHSETLRPPLRSLATGWPCYRECIDRRHRVEQSGVRGHTQVWKYVCGWMQLAVAVTRQEGRSRAIYSPRPTGRASQSVPGQWMRAAAYAGMMYVFPGRRLGKSKKRFLLINNRAASREMDGCREAWRRWEPRRACGGGFN